MHPCFYLRDVFDRLPEVIHDPLIPPHLQAACEAAPLSDPQKLALLGCRRAPQYLDLLRCHPRVLAERFLQNQIEPEVVAAFNRSRSHDSTSDSKSLGVSNRAEGSPMSSAARIPDAVACLWCVFPAAGSANLHPPAHPVSDC